MYIGFVIYVSVFALIMLLIFSKTCRKVVAGAIIFAILLGVVVLPLHGAMAEELPELFVIEQFEKVECEHGYLKLTFDFHGDLLSFYWEGPLNLTQPVWVTIWNNIEVVDAGYVELPSGSLLFYFLRQLGTDEHINRLYAGYGGVLCLRSTLTPSFSPFATTAKTLLSSKRRKNTLRTVILSLSQSIISPQFAATNSVGLALGPTLSTARFWAIRNCWRSSSFSRFNAAHN